MMSLFLLPFLFFIGISGSSAVTPVFVKTGEDLILNLTEAEIPTDSTIWSWKFTDKAMVTFINGSKPIVEKSYFGRLQTLKEKYNVKLQNLTKSDSGIYTAKLMVPKVKKLTEYNVTVQDPVSPIFLTIDSVSSTCSSCELTVTCTTEDSNIHSTIKCDHKTCHPEKENSSVVTKSGASLDMYLLNSSVICNHSNQVSWSDDVRVIKHYCRHCTDLSTVCLVKKVLFSVGLIIMVSAVFGVHLMEKVKKPKYFLNTSPKKRPNISS